MRKVFIFIGKIILLIISFLILLFAIFLIYTTVVDYSPDNKYVILKTTESQHQLNDTLSVISWNIGYSGLGQDMDFFYDGGEKTICSSQNYLINQEFIKAFVKSQKQIDFYFFQEIDINSRRSFFNDQRKLFNSDQHSYSYFSQNYKVPFIPLPVFHPLGKVNSGLLTLSSFKPYEVITYYFDGNYSWPTKLFMPDRCFTVLKFKTNNQADLILINTHNSAFDNGKLRMTQLDQLISFAQDEYEKGNYVVIGGDWNMNPPLISPINYDKYKIQENNMKIPDSFVEEGWKWSYDPNVPTNRNLDEAFNINTTKTTIIDFFLLSPNIKILEIKTTDLEFKASDHNPVYMRFTLIK